MCFISTVAKGLVGFTLGLFSGGHDEHKKDLSTGAATTRSAQTSAASSGAEARAADPKSVQGPFGGILILPVTGDATPMFNAAVQKLCAPNSPSRAIHFSAGFHYFRTPPAAMPCAIGLNGEGAVTTLVRAYSVNGPRDAFLAWTRGGDASGGSIRDMTIAADGGTNGGTAIAVIATKDPPIDFNANTNSLNRHSFVAINVRVGRLVGNNTSWDIGFLFDGSENAAFAQREVKNTPTASSGTDPQCTAPGIRAPRVIASTVSGTNMHSVVLDYVRDAQLDVGCYIPRNNSRADIYAVNHTVGVLQQSRACELRAGDDSVNDLRASAYTQIKP